MKISKSKQELARIISENGGWRDGCEWSVQSGEHGRIGFSENKPVRQGAKSWIAGGGFQFKIDVCKPLSNWHQCILSREEYFHLYPATGADGWIEWKGGECPVEKGTLVDVIWRDGTELAGVKALHLGGAGHQFWVADGMVNDIIAYRLHKPEQAQPEFCKSVMRFIPEPEINSKNISITQVDDINVVESKPTIEQLAADYRNAKDCSDRKQQEADDAMADAKEKLEELVAAGKELGLVIYGRY